MSSGLGLFGCRFLGHGGGSGEAIFVKNGSRVVGARRICSRRHVPGVARLVILLMEHCQ
jgi:hypothetical protein